MTSFSTARLSFGSARLMRESEVVMPNSGCVSALTTTAKCCTSTCPSAWRGTGPCATGSDANTRLTRRMERIARAIHFRAGTGCRRFRNCMNYLRKAKTILLSVRRQRTWRRSCEGRFSKVAKIGAPLVRAAVPLLSRESRYVKHAPGRSPDFRLVPLPLPIS